MQSGSAIFSLNRYNVETYRRFGTVFSYMPVAAVVGGKIFCVHGGISPNLQSLEQIRNIPRPALVPKQGLLTDLLWADPDSRIEGYAYNRERGVSIVFGQNEVRRVLVFLRSPRFRSELFICKRRSSLKAKVPFLRSRTSFDGSIWTSYVEVTNCVHKVSNSSLEGGS